MLSIIFTSIAALWNVMGDLAAAGFSWIAYWLVSEYLWRIPFVPDEGVILWRFAIPFSIGFILEHGGQLVANLIAGKGIGIHGEKGTSPFAIPSGTNFLFFLVWNILFMIWPVVILLGVAIVVILIVHARRSHP